MLPVHNLNKLNVSVTSTIIESMVVMFLNYTKTVIYSQTVVVGLRFKKVSPNPKKCARWISPVNIYMVVFQVNCRYTLSNSVICCHVIVVRITNESTSLETNDIIFFKFTL